MIIRCTTNGTMIRGVPDFMYFIVYYISVSIQKLNDAPVLGAIYLKSKWNLVSKYSNFHSSLYTWTTAF